MTTKKEGRKCLPLTKEQYDWLFIEPGHDYEWPEWLPGWEDLEPEKKFNPIVCPHCDHKIWMCWNAPDGIWVLSRLG